MSTEKVLLIRSESKCELCSATQVLSVYNVPPRQTDNAEDCLYLCTICREQIENPGKEDVNHWRCLNDSMWSQVPAVQVMAWRMLKRLSEQDWSQNLLDMLYLDDDTLAWAQADRGNEDDDTVKHIDSNGAELLAGDTVTLIKDLNVKGANFTAKRGTTVKGISLVANNPEHIEGRISGQQIVILTKFVKKSN